MSTKSSTILASILDDYEVIYSNLPRFDISCDRSTTLMNHNAVVAIPNADGAPQNKAKYCPNPSVTLVTTNLSLTDL